MIVTHRAESRWNSGDYIIGILAVILTFIFYLKTLAPTVTWGDPAKLTVFAHGFFFRPWASAHVLHNIIGWLWGQLPFTDYAYGQNLLSAIFASLTVGTVYLIAFKLTACRLPAALAALALGVSHTFWWVAVVAESYSLLLFLFAVCILATLFWSESRGDRWLYLFSFVFGLGISNHAIMPLFAPAFLLFFLLEDRHFLSRAHRLIKMGTAFLFGLLPLISAFIYSLRHYPLGDLIRQTTAGSLLPYWHDIAKIIRETTRYFLYLNYQFPGAGLVLGIAGIAALFRKNKKIFTLLTLLFLSDVVFSAGYMYQRQFETLLPSYLVFALAMGAGIGYLWEKARLKFNRGGVLIVIATALSIFLVLMPAFTYYVTPFILRKIGFDPLGARYIPYRENATYFFLPDKSGYYGAARYAKEVLDALPANAVILADFTPGMVLVYLQRVERIRADVLVVIVESPGSAGRLALETVGKYSGQRPIYLTDYRAYPKFFATTELSKEYNFIPKGHIFLMARKQ